MISFILYHYTPSIVAAIIFLILFSIATLLHVVQLARFRAWFMIPVLVGGACSSPPFHPKRNPVDPNPTVEITAYVCRSVSHSKPQSLIPFILSSVLSLVAPALFAATIYMTLGRIIRLLHAEHHSLIAVNKLTKIFVISDVLSFQIQSAGAGLQAGKAKKLADIGRVLVVVALFLQIIIFSLFIIVAIVFQRRTVRQPTQQSRGPLLRKRHMNGLYGASGLILVRNLVRVVQYIQGYSGYINVHEWFLYLFDALPMFGVMVLMVVIYAPRLFKQGQGEELGGELCGPTMQLQPKASEQREIV